MQNNFLGVKDFSVGVSSFLLCVGFFGLGFDYFLQRHPHLSAVDPFT